MLLKNMDEKPKTETLWITGRFILSST